MPIILCLLENKKANKKCSHVQKKQKISKRYGGVSDSNFKHQEAVKLFSYSLKLAKANRNALPIN